MKIKFELDDNGKYKPSLEYDYSILVDNVMLYFKLSSDKRVRLQLKKAINEINLSAYEIIPLLRTLGLDIKLIEYTNIYKYYVIDDYNKLNRYTYNNIHIL